MKALKDLLSRWNTREWARSQAPWNRKSGEIFDRAIEAYGPDHQMARLVEECAEFIVALEHFKRGRIAVDELVEEMVDIEILIDQMKHIFDREMWGATRSRKLARLNAVLIDFEKEMKKGKLPL